MIYGYDMGWGLGGLLIALGVLAVLIGVILLVVWAVSRTSGGGRSGGGPGPSTGPAPDQALAILRERFARGEITEAEYEHARQVLGPR